MLLLPLHVTHNLLTHVEQVFEVTYGRDAEGASTAVQGADHAVSMNLQPAGPKLVALLPEGAQGDGAKVMHTSAPIYVADNDGTGMQTYVRHGGEVWKVNQVENWQPHSPIGRWLLTRHLDISTP